MGRIREQDQNKWSVNLVYRRGKDGVKRGPYAVVSRTEKDGRHTQVYLGKVTVEMGLTHKYLYVGNALIDTAVLDEKLPPGIPATKPVILAALC